MSNERRHLRFLITSALLVGPALGCGSTEAETNVAPAEDPAVPEVNTQFDNPIEVERDPTGNPGGPGDEPLEPEERPQADPEPEPEADSADESPEETPTEDIEQIAEDPPPRTNVGRRRPERPPENRPRINAPPLPSER